MKLTKQGVRDLGGNRRIREEPDVVLRPFTVEVGEPGFGGMYLHYEAASARAAYRMAKDRLRDTNTPTWSILSVTGLGRVWYHHQHGWAA